MCKLFFTWHKKKNRKRKSHIKDSAAESVQGSILKNLYFIRMESKTFFYRGQNKKWSILHRVKVLLTLLISCVLLIKKMRQVRFNYSQIFRDYRGEIGLITFVYNLVFVWFWSLFFVWIFSISILHISKIENYTKVVFYMLIFHIK